MILACHNLNKSFGEQAIVKDGSFHIEDREKVALIGLNGAGKSTIIKSINKPSFLHRYYFILFNNYYL